METKHIVGLVAIVIAIIAAIMFISPAASNFGGVTNYDEVDVDALRVGGTNSSRVDLIATGSCNLSQSSAGSHGATTSKEYFCAVTGVSAGDTVVVSLPAGAGSNPNGASSLFGGFSLNGTYATTSDVIAVQLLNNTGAATSSFIQATTSVIYSIFSTRSTVPGL